MQLTARHLATVLAALRLYQDQYGLANLPHDQALELHRIATNEETHSALTNAEIDALCEDLNCGGDLPPAMSASLPFRSPLPALHDQLSALLEDPARDLYAETIFTLTADYLAANAVRLQDPPACHAPTGEHEDPEEATRLDAIRELANDKHAVDGKIEIDDNAIVSEGDDNGAYVAAWVWCDFEGTDFDKENECAECGEPNNNGEGYDGLCGNCADKKETTA